MDTIQQAVDELGVNETLDNVSPLKDDVDALVKCWHDLCQLSLMKQERLEQAKKVSRLSYTNFCEWAKLVKICIV